MTTEYAIIILEAYKQRLVNSVTIGLDKDIEAYDMAIKTLKQTDGDLISRQALLQKMWNDFYKMEDAHEKEQGFEYIGEKRTLEQNGFECAIKTVSEFPSAEKTAEWLQNPDDSAGCGYFICSRCECSVYDTEKYCPTCGAKMKKEKAYIVFEE